MMRTITELKSTLVSECCSAPTTEIEEIIKYPSPGVTAYYRKSCDKCHKECHIITSNLFDSNGKEVFHGDIIECPDYPENHAQRWHAVYEKINEYGQRDLQTRDLGCNNLGMCFGEECYTRGRYWKNLDILSDDDLDYYWNTTRAAAIELLKKELSV